MSVLSENIKKRFDQSGMTQRQFADRVGVTEVSLSRYLNDQRMPKAPILMKIAEILDTTTDELLGIKPDCDARHAFREVRYLIRSFEGDWTRAEKALIVMALAGWEADT